MTRRSRHIAQHLNKYCKSLLRKALSQSPPSAVNPLLRTVDRGCRCSISVAAGKAAGVLSPTMATTVSHKSTGAIGWPAHRAAEQAIFETDGLQMAHLFPLWGCRCLLRGIAC